MFRPEIVLSLFIPFLGTCLGAACVFLSRRELPSGTQKALTGFASGVMVAASVWSLLLPAMEMCAAMEHCSFCCSTMSFPICIWTPTKRKGFPPDCPGRP